MAAIAYPELEAPPAPGRPAAPHLRLVAPVPPRRRVSAVHRRRRVAVLVAVLLVAGVSWAAVGALRPAAPIGPASSAPPASVVVAGPGDTFWSIAVATGGEGDLRARVDALMAANGGASLRPGDRVVIPG
ncbi:MAG TPA: LysM peptidoglycan-binding domain-containing protein [Acidimicrobiales bacterium]|nr:LysM peptidoglycan-binding domain-containing protein [Acidimicrobiales bacterium]